MALKVKGKVKGHQNCPVTSTIYHNNIRRKSGLHKFLITRLYSIIRAKIIKFHTTRLPWLTPKSTQSKSTRSQKRTTITTKCNINVCSVDVENYSLRQSAVYRLFDDRLNYCKVFAFRFRTRIRHCLTAVSTRWSSHNDVTLITDVDITRYKQHRMWKFW